MRVEFRLFVVIGVFFSVVGLIYGIFTHWSEPVGPFGLFLCTGLSALIGFYLWWTGRKLDPRPEDDPWAAISAAEGEYGFFSPHSWWPLFTAASVALVALGVVFAWWLAILGMMFVILTAFGFVLEYYRGIHIP